MKLNPKKITSLEIIIWILFFVILLASSVWGMAILENGLLGIGLGVGVVAIIKIIYLAKEYQKHKKEIMAWAYRFCVFKIVPMFIPLLPKLFS